MAMFNMLGTELKFSTADHSQTDDLAQFSYNLHKSSATGMCPFELVYGQQPIMPHENEKYADKGRKPVEFGVGDQVLLKLNPQIWKKISSKTVHHGLISKYDGPFEVDLIDMARQQTRRAPPVIRKEFEKMVLKILDHRTMDQSKKNRRMDYLVHWTGESKADATWECNVTM
ncbi:UNVERIFIED_CONTAM: hypothetical protein Slati_0162000 [Sesamum latifolium]|uniref:Chromo domain-containing protein n=1 Tax=Sesamum latifolium TaxID=2727402 RepID=A0AAW2YAG4_9LAMI